MTLRALLSWLSFAALAGHGCAVLPDVEDDRCGNGVREAEAGEDCDGGADCGAPGTRTACRLQCASDGDCPAGACGVDGVCRVPSGRLDLVALTSVSATQSLLLRDLDGDGCAELARTDLRGTEVTAFESLDPGACRPARRDFTPGVLPEGRLELRPLPAPTDVTGREGGELVFVGDGLSGQGLYLLETGEEATFTSTVFGSTAMPVGEARAFGFALGDRDVSLFLGRGGDGESQALLVVDPRRNPVDLSSAFDLGGALPAVAAVVTVDEGDDACPRVVFAAAGAAALSVTRICPGLPPSEPGGMATRPTAQSEGVIRFPGAGTLNATPALYAVDLDADGVNDDLVVSGTAAPGADGPPDGSSLYLAYRRDDGTFGGTATAGAEEGRLAVDLSRFDEVLPPNQFFAVGQFLADEAGVPEVVALPCPPPERSMRSPSCDPIDRRCEAVVADFNGDGFDDVVANVGAQSDLAVRLGGGDGDLPVSFIETRCPPRALTAADLDGDRILDVAYLDQFAPGDTPVDALAVAFGRAQATPETPVIQGSFAGAVALAGGRFEAAAETDQLASLRLLPTAVAPGPGGGAPNLSKYALIEGSTQRLVLAPFLFPSQSGMGAVVDRLNIVATSGGRFGGAEAAGGADETAAAIAVVTAREPGPGSRQASDDEATLWLLTSTFDGTDLASRPTEGSVRCDDCQLVAIDLDPPPEGQGRDELLLLSDEGVAIYGASDGRFERIGEVATAPGFSSQISLAVGPDRYAARPEVADVDADGHDDVVAVDGSGHLVVFFGDGAGGLTVQRWRDAPCGFDVEGCRPSPFALLELDGTPGPELVLVTAPDGAPVAPGDGPPPRVPITAYLRAFDVGSDRALEPLVVEVALQGDETVPADFVSDLFAVSAGDFDGDGVDDVVMALSSSVVYVLRGEPVNE
ncbi:MAG: VCBS repeat-containing protein [Myxococcota bacterium]